LHYFHGMKNAISLFLAILFVITASAQSVETPDQRAKRMSWWREAKFGLFLHWGIYSVAAGEYDGQKNDGEWLMNEARLSLFLNTKNSHRSSIPCSLMPMSGCGSRATQA
jgi:hypothetical protein